MADEPRASSYFFKAFGTGIVLGIAFSIVGAVTSFHIWGLVYGIGVLSFIALVIAIVLSIWE